MQRGERILRSLFCVRGFLAVRRSAMVDGFREKAGELARIQIGVSEFVLKEDLPKHDFNASNPSCEERLFYR